MKMYLKQPWFLCYEGEGEGEAKEPPPVDPPNPDDDKPTLSQKQVNKILAEEKRKYQAQITKQVQDLETLKKSKGLSDKEKTDLQSRIEELQNSLLSKEQLSQKEREKLSSEHKKQLETISGEKDQWKGLFHKTTIERVIIDEAIKAEAFSPSQIVALLGNSTRLVEALDSDGNPIPGEFVAKVRFKDTDKEGKPVTLELTIPEAVTRMKDRTNEFGNLFKSNLTGGLGSSGGTGSKTEKDPGDMSPEEYRIWRNKRMGRKPQQ